MTVEELNKARLYAIDKMRYNEIHTIFNEVETTVKLFSNIFYLFIFQIGIIIDWCSSMVMEKIW
jgi:hypothetical protein